MRYIWEDLEKLDVGDRVIYDIEDGQNVHVMIMTYDNYTRFRHGQAHRYFGGVATDNKVSIKVPFKSNWVAVAFAFPFGFVKNCKISTSKFVGEYKKEAEVIDTTVSENIDESQNESMTEFYSLINDFENNVRKFITKALKNAYGEDDYITKGIDNKILESAEYKLNKEKEINIKFKIEPTIIDYVDFGELQEIITNKKNWSNVFEKLFKKKNSVLHLYEQIANFRRPTAHNRVIEHSEITSLKVYMKDWDNNISSEGRKLLEKE